MPRQGSFPVHWQQEPRLFHRYVRQEFLAYRKSFFLFDDPLLYPAVCYKSLSFLLFQQNQPVLSWTLKSLVDV